MVTSTLTKRQAQVFKYIRNLIKKRGYSPTVREIGDQLGIKSPNGVICHLRILEKKGLISRKANRSRAMRVLVDPFDTEGLPVVGIVVNGRWSEPETEERVDFGKFFDDSKCFVVKVEGSSLKDDQIADGDSLVVRKQRTAKRDQVVVVTDAQRKVSLMSWKPEKNSVRLQPTNKRKKPIHSKDVTVLGLLVGVVRKLD